MCVESSKKKEDTLNELIDKSIRKKTMFCTTGDSNTRPRGKGGASLDTKTTRAASPSCPSVTQIIYMVSFKLIEISTTKNFFPKILGGQLPPLAPMWLRLWHPFSKCTFKHKQLLVNLKLRPEKKHIFISNKYR